MKRFEVDFKCLALDGVTYENHTCYLVRQSEADVRSYVRLVVELGGYYLDHFTLEDIREADQIQNFDDFVVSRRKTSIVYDIQKGLTRAGLKPEKLNDGAIQVRQFEIRVLSENIEVIIYSEPQVSLPEIRERRSKRKVVHTAQEVLTLIQTT